MTRITRILNYRASAAANANDLRRLPETPYNFEKKNPPWLVLITDHWPLITIPGHLPPAFRVASITVNVGRPAMRK